MTSPANHESETPGQTPPPGTREYQEHFESQGQAAMDATLANPITRIAFGLLALCFTVFLPLFVVDAFQRYPMWLAPVVVLGLSGAILPFILEIGSVAILGRSRTAWFRALMRRFHVSHSE